MAVIAVFDVDDTLYLEREYVRSGFRAVDEHLRVTIGCEGFADVAWALFLSGIRGDTFNRALAEIGLTTDADRIDELVGVYRAHSPEIRLLEDADTLLRECRRLDVPVAIVTDGPSMSQWSKLDALGLKTAASPIFVTEDHGPDWRKPSPKAFHAIQDTFGFPSQRYIYIADNPMKDFAGPKRLGWQTIRVRRPESLHQGVPSGSDVDLTVPHLPRLDTGPLEELLFHSPARVL